MNNTQKTFFSEEKTATHIKNTYCVIPFIEFPENANLQKQKANQYLYTTEDGNKD